MDNEIIIIISAVLFVVFLISIFTRRKEPANVDPPEKRAGKIGEQYARFEISKVLWETDILLNNISITRQMEKRLSMTTSLLTVRIIRYYNLIMWR